ncbi:MAG: 50S ribosomal protein L25/general stress protein Ctc [Flavobacteriaceae bacterium]|nr:50S ribosomal protein L25/general stress protein Ctc [Flavobacteriaceae bacterium]|tara:strand:- start:2807 stop:3505 length:699 start_codon:yes stop_codon:yes gene_type:complete
MKSITIKGSKRESVGKVATKALRNAGRVPCVVYGGDNPLHFSALELDFSKLVYTPNAHTVLITMENGTEINAILQDIQFHPVNDSILHIDFYQLFDNKEVSINVPVRIKGAAPGVLNSGGTLIMNKRKLKVKAIPANLPDEITVDISELELGDKIYTADLKNENYILLHSENMVVCQVKISRASILEEEEEGAEGAEGAEGTEGAEGAEGAKSTDSSQNPDKEGSDKKSSEN